MTARRPSLLQDLAWRAQAALYDGLGALLRLVPVDWASDLGGAAFKAFGPLTRSHRIARRNIDIAFPGWSAADKARLLRDQWDNLGRTFFEFPLTDRLTPRSGRVEVVGGERLEALARAQGEGGEGAILVSGHFANWEIMAAVIADSSLNCRVTYRAANNPYFDRRLRKTRGRYGVKLFAPKGGEGSRDLLATLKGGESVAFLNDQKFNTGVAAPFFGVECRTAGAPTRMGLRFGGALHPMSIERVRRARFRVVIHPPIPLAAQGDRDADIAAGVAKLNTFIEARVRERPAEWFWVHKRWPNPLYEDAARES